ncbi:membrane-associated progesterone receptor component 1-like [Uranotaenia lowii]|uniref:membrane-associated progesterone receptor component 1-like n=1 Tax=Uranotaenia lowii TaxID=190385 RepID=UPI0024793AAE|nr:membrane-associated progesterone receptor component 1-like [Uranotaenia lowii]
MAEEKLIPESPAEEAGFLSSFVSEIVNSPLNLVLVGVITFLIYKIFRTRQQPISVPAPAPELPRLRKDFTVAELRQFDGTQPDGRVLVAVNGSVYDVTKGKRFYGPGGPYAAFGGRDASRGLATFSVTSNDQVEYDDLSDLTPMEMESVLEWEMQFKEKYILVGRLLKPGEQPTNYSDEDDETTNESTPTGDKTAKAPVAAAASNTTSNTAKTTSDSSSKPEPAEAAAAKKAEQPSKVEEVKTVGGGDHAE